MLLKGVHQSDHSERQAHAKRHIKHIRNRRRIAERPYPEAAAHRVSRLVCGNGKKQHAQRNVQAERSEIHAEYEHDKNDNRYVWAMHKRSMVQLRGLLYIGEKNI